MNYHICTISFRHELVSLGELLPFAARRGFAGFELWGPHGRALLRQRPADIPPLIREMRRLGVGVAMISDYVDLNADASRFETVTEKWRELFRLARTFGTAKIRIFAGSGGSLEASAADWATVVGRLRLLAELSSEHGIFTLVETHPQTYADRLDTAALLMEEANHPYLGINLDFLHLWETGTSPLAAWQRLKPWVRHLHLKNVARSGQPSVFAPDNVYSPSGDRTGMVPLSEGAVDYAGLLPTIAADAPGLDASLEWFGPDPFRYLSDEIAELSRLTPAPASRS
ncbi:sugar phosphate isomerase/epimerase family protein [Cohnella zeiphila]|uniref:Sugar phosphate isomerase/epimerase n=1 Tax=Cohnella zeiphila TaxID=2761120 RepID=A0A7X0SHA7_9BACL|nr:sugar phosphate isomerase/epimerase [Cohnella zeiphila]MBB6729980.1 sugar phosphate isomerase/epimerase [Cohnella zeiphila]